MLSNNNLVQVLLPLALDQAFTYKSSIDVECGDVVKVEFGKKEIWGVVTAENLEAPTDIAPEKIKEILEKNANFKLSKKQLEFIEGLASYNLASRGLVLRAFIGILNSDKVKKLPVPRIQEVEEKKFNLKNLLPEQKKISDELDSIINKNSFSVSLIDGLTGSGKTEIYFKLIAEILGNDNNSQVLILLPEIALTSQILSRFSEQFGFEAAIWHSKISKKEKREVFYGIAKGSVRVLIGARSALLLPFKNLQLIVVDEEHDASFKQEDVFNFQARDMAILKAKIEGFSTILSSATPSIETYANALAKKYHYFSLQQRFGQTNNIELIDLRQEKLDSGNILSKKLCAEIHKNLVAQKQTLLFLNRRGYAPVLLCKSCAKKYECSNCDFHLVLHKKQNRLTCHHCGHEEKFENICKFCGEKGSLISLGFGVEKIEEEVKNLFPEARIGLVTSDTVASFSEAKNLVEKILNNEIDILIGTQMISKGYDFPNLNLVGILDADSLLYSSELRALERAYQIVTQVSGRAGRREVAGKVMIQTYDVKNFLFEKIVKGDKKSFYDFEIANRKNMEMPPFSRFIRFEVSSFNADEAKNFARELIRNFPIDEKIEIFGPAPAVIQRLKNRHHFLVNLKASKKVNLQKLVNDVMQNITVPKSVRIRIDVDPN